MSKFIISKPGYDALTESNPDHIVFSSDYNTFKYFVSGSLEINLNTGTEFEVTVAHNLGYKPVHFGYLQWEVGATRFYVLLNRSWADAGYYFHVHMFVDDTYLRVKVRQDSVRDLPGTIKYKIYKNKLGI